VLDHKDKTLTVLDPMINEDCFQDMPFKRYARRIIHIAPYYMRAMGVANPEWSQDIFRWQTLTPDDIAKDKDG